MSKLTLPIQWYEGMSLGPQHLQQNDLRFEQLSTFYFQYASNHAFGVIKLVLDDLYIVDGIIRIKEVDAVLPDGLIVNYRSQDYPNFPLVIDLKKIPDYKNVKNILVNLCIAERGELSPINGDLPRFIATEGAEISDDNLHDNVISIPRLLPKLFLSEEVPGRCVGIPIIQVEFTEEGFQLTPYLPPKFFLNKDDKLIEDSNYIVQQLRKKIAYLSERWQNQVGTPMLQETVSLLKPLLSALPELEATLNQDNIAPHVLHTVLVRSLGNILTLNPSQIPAVLPAYNHKDILNSTDPYINYIQQYLANVNESFASFSFNQKDRLFYLRLHADYLNKASRIFVGFCAPKGSSEYQMQEWVNDAVICSDKSIDIVTSKRITGAHRQLLTNEELAELMPARGVLIYEVKLNNEFIIPNQNLNIFNPADTPEKRPSEIVLYVKKVDNE